MPSADAVEMYVALMGFTGSVLPNVVENVNQTACGAARAPRHPNLPPEDASGAHPRLIAPLMNDGEDGTEEPPDAEVR
eukprot:gene13366-19212_t